MLDVDRVGERQRRRTEVRVGVSPCCEVRPGGRVDEPRRGVVEAPPQRLGAGALGQRAATADIAPGGGDPSRSALRQSREVYHGHAMKQVLTTDEYRAVFHLGEQQRGGHAHVVREFVGTHDEYERGY
jgi:hypothetical protein